MIRTRKFVVPALVAALWVAVFGFVPRAISASPSSNDVREACLHLDTISAHQTAHQASHKTSPQSSHQNPQPTAHVCAAGPQANPFDGNGVNVDENGLDVACCEASTSFAATPLSRSAGEHRDRPYVWSHWESLAARAPPQN